jgi:pre-mRNA-splicing factor ATP-dependent RNA helicase DHX38/PRP16
MACQHHTFRQPVKPIEPPTPRGSLLGLDRLAIEKRTAITNESDEGSRKKARIDVDEPFFKGMISDHLCS